MNIKISQNVVVECKRTQTEVFRHWHHHNKFVLGGGHTVGHTGHHLLVHRKNLHLDTSPLLWTPIMPVINDERQRTVDRTELMRSADRRRRLFLARRWRAWRSAMGHTHNTRSDGSSTASIECDRLGTATIRRVVVVMMVVE